MIIDSKSLQNHSSINADLCIMGVGVAGITLARELLPKFRSIVLLESGDETYDLETQDLYKAASSPGIFPDPSISRLRFLGGSSNH